MMHVCLLVVRPYGEKKTVREVRVLADDHSARPFMLTEQMCVGVWKNEEERLQVKREENASHMVFVLIFVISSHPFIFCFSIHSP
jgi:hypothetical protein